MGLMLDLCCYGIETWSAEVSHRGDGDYLASATGATLDEARNKVLARLTPEQLADLATSMIADLAAVAKAMGYECTPHDDLTAAYGAEGVLWGAAFDTGEYAWRQVLGYALALDTLHREQEAADG